MAVAHDADRGTEIEWEKYDSRAHVFSDEAAIARRLLRHPLFEADQVLESDGEPIAVEGTFPIRAVKLCSFQRSRAGHSQIVPYDTQQKREYVRENMMEDDEDE